MSRSPSSSFPSFIALHKASSNRFCTLLMIHGAHSPPILFPPHIPIPLSFPSLPEGVGTTASSYAIKFQSSEEIPILVPIFLPLVRQTQSQSHTVTCLSPLRRPIQTLRFLQTLPVNRMSPHQLGSSTPVASTLTRRQGRMGCQTSPSRQAMVECPSPLIQSAPTLSCTQRPD